MTIEVLVATMNQEDDCSLPIDIPLCQDSCRRFLSKV